MQLTFSLKKQNPVKEDSKDWKHSIKEKFKDGKKIQFTVYTLHITRGNKKPTTFMPDVNDATW